MREAGLEPDSEPGGLPLLDVPDEKRDLDEVGRFHLTNKNMLKYINEEQEGGAFIESMDALLVDFLAQSERQAFENERSTAREKVSEVRGLGIPKWQ